MAQILALFNPISCNGNGEKSAHRLDEVNLEHPITYIDMTGISDYEDFFRSIESEDQVIVCGGDGTLNRFLNATYEMNIQNELFYFACGTGNDFLHDIGREPGGKPIPLWQYIKGLPQVKVNGKTYRFLNNVGFGIDGYCAEVGDEMRQAHKENINYTAIAIKGLLGGFHPVNASVTVDGVTKNYRRVWLAPTMKGRYYGGGMMPTPAQDRLAEDKSVSVMVFYGRGKFPTLMAFPSIFQGEHIRHTDMVEIQKGQNVKVHFSRPCPLQIDGEVIPNVSDYEVITQAISTQ